MINEYNVKTKQNLSRNMDEWRSTEYHMFRYGSRILLFDVETLQVHRLTNDEFRLLDKNKEFMTQDNWIQTGISCGLTPKAAQKSFSSLCKKKIIIPKNYEVNTADDILPAYDYTFMVNVSQTCNLSCSYCYTNKGKFDFDQVNKTNMDQEDAKKLVHFVVKNFPQSLVCCFHFYGGEPLLNFNAIKDLVHETQTIDDLTKRFEFAITTNGTLLTKEVADFMDEHHFTIFFSIDGPKKVQNKFRIFDSGAGSYDLVKKNLDYLVTKKNIKLIGSSVIRSGWTLPEAEKFLTSVGADAFKAERVRVSDCDPLHLTKEEQENYIKDLDTLYDIYVDALLQNKKPLDYRLSSKILQLLTKRKRSHFCPAGGRMFGITTEGEIYPCSLHAGRNESLLGTTKEGLDKNMVDNFRRRISSSAQPDCETCWSRNICGGGCSAMVERFGHEDCDILRKKAEIAIAIYDKIAHVDELKLLNLVSPKTVKMVESTKISGE